MEGAIGLCEFGADELLESFDGAELEGNLSADADEGHEHALVEGGESLLGDGLAEGVQVSLVVLLGLGNHLDLDVLERHHADHLRPPRHAPAEEVLDHLDSARHVTYFLGDIILGVNRLINFIRGRYCADRESKETGTDMLND